MLQVKFGARAYKNTIQGLKKLCDFFAIERYLTTTKDALVDKLLDFLGAPQKDKVVNGSGKVASEPTKSKTTKRAKTKKTTKDEDDDEEEEKDTNDDVEDDGYDDVDDDKLKNEEVALPSQEKLRKWVRAYVRCFHEVKLTVNHALEVGSEKFGVDLLPMKANLKKLLIEEL